jgi:hypothetical protein
MIYFFTGTDEERTRAKAFEWIARARAKEPQLAYARLSRDELTAEALEAAGMAEGLFVRRLLVLIDDPFSKKEGSNGKEIAESQLEMLEVSNNAIVILAPLLPAPLVKKIKAKAKLTYAFDLQKKETSARGFNAGLVNALGARSKAKLWMEVVRALRAGDAPEMLHGLLHWKARDLMSKQNRIWPPEEARELSLKLIELLEESRRGGLDLPLSLERFALSI